MGDDDDGKDVATNSDIDEVDHRVDHLVDLNEAALAVDHQVDHHVEHLVDLDKAALGVDHLVDHHVDYHVEHLVDLDKAALGVDHHGLEDRLLGRQRWGSIVASLSPVLK